MASLLSDGRYFIIRGAERQSPMGDVLHTMKQGGIEWSGALESLEATVVRRNWPACWNQMGIG